MSDPINISVKLLPPLLQEFERMIGLPATMALVHAVGGLRVYFPTPDRVTPDHQFVPIIGLDNLFKVAHAFGGQAHFALPKASRALLAVRNTRIAADYRTCKTAREIAIEYGLTEGQVVRIVAAQGATAPPDRRQRMLF